jgi:hypothetical protein
VRWKDSIEFCKNNFENFEFLEISPVAVLSSMERGMKILKE